jgi:uncharacterized glyoxalase superfamily protein PhnB
LSRNNIPIRHVAELNLNKENPMTTKSSVKPIPDGMPAVTPHLVCAGANKAIDFYVEAFGAEDVCRLAGPEGKLMHGMIRIGGSPVMLVDEFPMPCCKSPLTLKGSPVTLHLYVEDVDAAFKKAVTAGATVVMPLAEMFWGDRYGIVQDPFGHLWSLATHVKDLTPEEIAKAAENAKCGEPSS